MLLKVTHLPFLCTQNPCKIGCLTLLYFHDHYSIVGLRLFMTYYSIYIQLAMYIPRGLFCHLAVKGKVEYS